MSKTGYGERSNVVANGSTAGGAIHNVEAGKSTDMVFHLQFDKMLYVASGKIKLAVIQAGKMKSIEMSAKDAIHVPVGLVHQIIAVDDSMVVEFASSTAMYHSGNPDIRIISRGTPLPEEEDKPAVQSTKEVAKPVAQVTKEKKKRAPRKKKTTKRKSTRGSKK